MKNKNDKETVLDHDYDGIQEFDNPLPGWWLATFYGAIVFSVLYLGYYHFGGPGIDPHKELEADMNAIKVQQALNKKQDSGPDENTLLAAFNDTAKKSMGKTIYSEKCASCHAPDGGGIIGPNLTDKFWIHGDGSLLALLPVISDGVPEKGMPPWKALLKQEEIIAVTAYVKSLNGTHAANPKAPQGNEVKN